MKTALVVLSIGFVSLVVIAICVLAIVTSTNRGAAWFQGKTDPGAGTKKPPESS